MSAVDTLSLELASCFEQGLALLESQAWKPALACFTRGLEIDPGRTGLWHNRAWCHLHLGDPGAAQADLQALLERAPGHAPALALLGRVRLAQGAPEEGIALLQSAWVADPADPDIACQALDALLLRPEGEREAARRARILVESGQLDRAGMRQLQEVLGLSPAGHEALRQLWAQLCTGPRAQPWMFGAWVDLCRRGREVDETALAATLWLRHEPGSDAARHALMWALSRRGDLAALLPLAIERAREQPRDVEAMVGLSVLLTEARDEAQRDAGLCVLAHALSLNPEDARPWLLRGHYFAKVFLHQEAMQDFTEALRIDPLLTAAHCGMIRSLAALGRHEQARQALEAFVVTDEHSRFEREAASAFILRTEARVQEAESVLRGCAERGESTSRWELGSLLLIQGRYAEGWALWRGLTHDSRPRPLWHRLLALGARPWNGDLVQARGRTLMVVSDTGLGDALQFARFLPALRARGVKLVLCVQAAVRRLLGRMDPEIPVLDVEDVAAFPRADLVCSLWDLPMLLDVRLDELHRWGPAHYLQPHDSERAAAAPDLGPAGGLRVALGWRGNRSPLAERSIALERFAQLEVPGVEWFSLQRELQAGAETIAARRMGLRHADWSLDQSALALPQMDLVVSVDTVLCHLAGALGVPALVLLPLACDWRWGMAPATTSPWYPRSILVRQRRSGDWSEPLAELDACLRQRVADRAAGSSERDAHSR